MSDDGAPGTRRRGGRANPSGLRLPITTVQSSDINHREPLDVTAATVSHDPAYGRERHPTLLARARANTSRRARAATIKKTIIITTQRRRGIERNDDDDDVPETIIGRDCRDRARVCNYYRYYYYYHGDRKSEREKKFDSLPGTVRSG